MGSSGSNESNSGGFIGCLPGVPDGGGIENDWKQERTENKRKATEEKRRALDDGERDEGRRRRRRIYAPLGGGEGRQRARSSRRSLGRNNLRQRRTDWVKDI